MWSSTSVRTRTARRTDSRRRARMTSTRATTTPTRSRSTGTNSRAVMYVKNDVLKEIGKPIPKTWDEFEATSLAAIKKDASGKVTRYGFAFNTDASYFNAQVYSRGGSLMAADNKTVAWNGKEGLAVLQMYDRMNKNGSGYRPKRFD